MLLGLMTRPFPPAGSSPVPFIIALSGAVASGKSTLADALVERLGANILSTRALIKTLRAAADERGILQMAGDALDDATAGSWVADGVAERLGELAADAVLVVDAVRKPMQVARLRERWPGRIRHVHLQADPGELERRYVGRLAGAVEGRTYSQVKADPTEAAIEAMVECADAVVETGGIDGASLAALALAGSPLVTTRIERLVDVIVGAQYGSEGKGNVCAALSGDYAVLMRVGGPNAGHKVRDPDFTFRQLPSGSAHNRVAKLLIGAGATIDVDILLDEIAQLDELGYAIGPRLAIDPRAVVIEASDRDYENAGLEGIASTRQGVGVATARKIVGRSRGDDLGAKVRLARQAPELAPFVRRVDHELEAAYAAGLAIMLEGTQGTDLSLHHGDWPNVTSRDTTTAGCLSEAGIAPGRVRRVVMVTRTFPIRVGGTSGDFAAGEIGWRDVADRSGIALETLERDELGSVSKNLRRVGAFSLEQVRRSAVLNGATDIALTFVDYLAASNAAATTRQALDAGALALIERIERVVGVPVTYVVKGGSVGDVLGRGRVP